MTRKEFLKTFGIAVVAVSVAGLSSIEAEAIPTLYGDGVHDDTVAVQALIDGKKVMTVDGSTFKASSKRVVDMPFGTFFISGLIAGQATLQGHKGWTTVFTGGKRDG